MFCRIKKQESVFQVTGINVNYLFKMFFNSELRSISKKLPVQKTFINEFFTCYSFSYYSFMLATYNSLFYNSYSLPFLFFYSLTFIIFKLILVPNIPLKVFDLWSQRIWSESLSSMRRDVAANIYITNVVIVIFLLMFCYALEILLKLIFFKTSFTLYFNQKFEFTFFIFVSLNS